MKKGESTIYQQFLLFHITFSWTLKKVCHLVSFVFQSHTCWLIVWCFTPFSTVIQLKWQPVHLSLSSLKPVLHTIYVFFSNHWLPSNITIVETTNSSERGMNPVAMTIINPQKEYWLNRGSNQQPPVLKSAMQPTELCGSAVVLVQ